MDKHDTTRLESRGAASKRENARWALPLIFMACSGLNGGCGSDNSQPLRSAGHFQEIADKQVATSAAEEKMSELPSESDRTGSPTIVEEVRKLYRDSPRLELSRNMKAPIRDELAKEWTVWYRQVFVEPYKQFSRRDPAWDAKALALLEEFSLHSGPPAGSFVNRDMDAAARELIKSGCDDPLIQALALNLALDNTPENGNLPYGYFDLDEKSVAGFVSQGYPPLTAHLGGLVLIRHEFTKYRSHLPYQPDTLPSVKLFDQLEVTLPQIIELLSQPNMSDVERRMWMIHVDEALVDGLGVVRETFLERLTKSPTADPWILRMLAAREHKRAAWRARGHGFAGSVTEEGWKGFHAHMERCRALLLEAWKLQPKQPHAAADLVEVTMAVGGVADETPRFWFDQAVKAQFDYHGQYNYLTQSLLPRWGGSHESMLAFGRECLATERFDTEIPKRYHDLMLSIASEVESPREVFEQPGVYEDYSKLLAGYRLKLKEDEDEDRCKYDSQLACIAWMHGHTDQARKLLESLGRDVNADVFTEFGASLSEVRRALSGQPESHPARADFTGHAGAIVSAAVSNDGTTLITAGVDETVRLWDISARQAKGELAGHEQVVAGVAAANGTAMAATACLDGKVRIWNLDPPGLKSTFENDGPALSVAFSPDDRILAVGGASESSTGQIRLWDTEKQEFLATLAGHAGPVRNVAFSPDGTRLVTTAGKRTSPQADSDDEESPSAPPGEAIVWDVATRTELSRYAPFAGPVFDIAWSPDGQQLAVSGTEGTDFEVRILDAATGNRLHTLAGHDGPVVEVRYLQDGATMATAGVDGTIQLWETVQGTHVATYEGHENAVTALALVGKGPLLAAADAEGAIRLWDTSQRGSRADHRIRLADAEFEGGIHVIRIVGERPSVLVMGPYSGAFIWDASVNCESALPIPLPSTGMLRTADLSPDGRLLATVDNDQRTRSMRAPLVLVDLDTQVSQTLSLPPELRFDENYDDVVEQQYSVLNAVFSPDGRTLATGGVRNRIFLWDLSTRQPWPWGALAPGAANWVVDMAFSNDGKRLASVDSDGTVYVWELPEDFATAKVPPLTTQKFSDFPEKPTQVRLSPDGRKLVVGYGDSELWEVDDKKLLAKVPGAAVAFAPDGMRFATGGGKLGTQARIWDATTGEELVRLQGSSRDEIRFIAYAPNGRRILTGSYDQYRRRNGRVVCWDVETGLDVPDFSGMTTDQGREAAGSP